MISHEVDGSVIYNHAFFEAFVLQLNVMSKGAGHKFPPEAIVFIIDGLRTSGSERREDLLSELDPISLLTMLTCSDAQVRETVMNVVTLFILSRKEPCFFFYDPVVFAQIATFFIASQCPGKVLWLKFCHALLVTSAVDFLALFIENPKIQKQLSAPWPDRQGEEDPEHPGDPGERGWDDDDARETLHFSSRVMDDVYSLRWISDHTSGGGEPLAYCIDTVLLIMGADTQILAQNSGIPETIRINLIARLGEYEDFIQDLSDIAEMGDETPYALADGTREVVLPLHAQWVLDNLLETLS
jgi:hypothetical protein